MELVELVDRWAYLSWWRRTGGGQVELVELVEARQAGPSTSSSTAHGGTTASGTTTFPEPIFGIFDIFGTLLPSFRRHPYYDQDN